MITLDTASSALAKIETIIDDGVNAVVEQGIHEYTAPTNMSALYMVDERTATSPILKDLLGLQLSLTTARIAQAFELRNTVKGISVIDHIKSARLGFKENKSLIKRIFGLESIDLEDGEITEKTTKELIALGSFTQKDIVEDKSQDAESEIVSNEAIDGDDKLKNEEIANVSSVVSTKNLLSDAADTIGNFAVGSMFDITLQDKGDNGSEKVTVTLAMRISPIAVKPEVVKAILEVGSYKNSFVERFYAFKAGDISLMQFLTLSDIVDQQVSVLLKDKSGYYREVLKRQTKNVFTGIKSLISRQKIERTKTIGGLIIDAETLAEAEVVLGGSFDTDRIRNQVFSVTSAATICVIDSNWETVKIYYRGIDYVETYTFNQIRRSSKGGVSVEDMLEAFRRGGAPKL